jgi:hypothetical protein
VADRERAAATATAVARPSSAASAMAGPRELVCRVIGRGRILLAIGQLLALNRPPVSARVNADDGTHPILKGVPATFVNYGHGDQISSAPPLPTMIDDTLRWLLSR